MAKNRESKDLKKKIDLSNESCTTYESRHVKDYDYDLLQKNNSDTQFENDLDYLLESVDNGTYTGEVNYVVEPTNEEILTLENTILNGDKMPKGKKKKFKISLDDITKDMDDINFSSDSEDEPSEKKSSIKAASKKDIKKLHETNATDKPDESDTADFEIEQMKQRRKEKRRRKDLRRKLRRDNKQDPTISLSTEQSVEPEIESQSKAESNVPIESSEPNRSIGLKKEKSKRTKRKNADGRVNNTTDNLEDHHPPITTELTDAEINKALNEEEGKMDSSLNDNAKKSKKKSKNKKKKYTVKPKNEELPPNDTVLVSKSDELVTVEELKNQKVVNQEYSIYDAESNLTRKQRDKLNREKQATLNTEAPTEKSNPFNVTLKSTKKQNPNKKYTESLPSVLSVKTIIGLSHQQILALPLSDVKIKTIVSSSSISKFAHHVLKFAIKYSHDLFKDEEKKRAFFKLCIHVALYESAGFKKTVQTCTHVLEWFGGFDELTLNQTHTKLTPSNRDIHQNNFDYSVLAYLGHILIWAAHQQRQNHMTLFFDKYELDLSISEIERSIGGFHLWDRLNRLPESMNTKRWKHIIKFRHAFAYEEDQFMLILRFMAVDASIP